MLKVIFIVSFIEVKIYIKNTLFVYRKILNSSYVSKKVRNNVNIVHNVYFYTYCLHYVTTHVGKVSV